MPKDYKEALVIMLRLIRDRYAKYAPTPSLDGVHEMIMEESDRLARDGTQLQCKAQIVKLSGLETYKC